VLAATGYIAIWQLIVISLLSGVVMSFNHPARQAIVPNLVSKDYLLNAVSVDILSIQVSRAIGMPIAGYVILTAGVWPIFALRALGCLLAVFWILMVNVPPTSATARTQAPWRNLAQGFHYLRGNIVVLAVVLSFFIPILVQSAYTSFLPVFAGDILRIDAVGYGYLQGAPGVGAILFLIGLSLLTYYNGKLRLLIISIALLGVGLLGFSLSNWFFLSLLMLVVIGAMAAAFLAINTTLLQGMVPDEMRGRIMSWREISFGLGPAGSIMFGALALHTGVQFSLGSLGSICLILSLALIILLPRLRSAG
jgi:MFS family permease